MFFLTGFLEKTDHLSDKKTGHAGEQDLFTIFQPDMAYADYTNPVDSGAGGGAGGGCGTADGCTGSDGSGTAGGCDGSSSGGCD